MTGVTKFCLMFSLMVVVLAIVWGVPGWIILFSGVAFGVWAGMGLVESKRARGFLGGWVATLDILTRRVGVYFGLPRLELFGWVMILLGAGLVVPFFLTPGRTYIWVAWVAIISLFVGLVILRGYYDALGRKVDR